MTTFYRQIRYLTLILSASALAVACGDDDVAYEPGEATATDCMNVYFSPDNEVNFVLDPESMTDGFSVNLALKRVNAELAADIPVIVELADACFEIPSTVHFTAGETDAEIKVSFPDIPMREAKKFFLKIPNEYVDLYSENAEGTGRYAGSVLVSEWLKIVKEAEIFSYSYYQIDYKAPIYWLAGANRFRFGNFLDSGINLTFKLDGTAFDPENPSTWHGYITPLDNYEVRSYTSSGALYWYFYDDANGKRARWTTSVGAEQKGNICFYSRADDMDFNLVDGGIDNIPSCHGWVYKRNSSSDWVYFYYDEVNLEGYKD